MFVPRIPLHLLWVSSQRKLIIVVITISNAGKTLRSGSVVREEDFTIVLENVKSTGKDLCAHEGVYGNKSDGESWERGCWRDDEGMKDVKFISLSLFSFGQVSRV